MQTLLRIALAALAAGLALAPAAAQTGAAERQQIEQIIREYLLANPEVIEEAVNALRQKREAEAVAAQSRAIEERREAIFDSPHQAVLGNPEGPITLVEFFD